MKANRKYCKLDDKSNLSFELEELNNKTFMTIIDTNGNKKVCSYVDKYRLLKLADYIYKYLDRK